MPSDPDPDLTGFVEIAHRIVWCTLATVGRGRPRSRLVHPAKAADLAEGKPQTVWAAPILPPHRVRRGPIDAPPGRC